MRTSTYFFCMEKILENLWGLRCRHEYLYRIINKFRPILMKSIIDKQCRDIYLLLWKMRMRKTTCGIGLPLRKRERCMTLMLWKLNQYAIIVCVSYLWSKWLVFLMKNELSPHHLSQIRLYKCEHCTLTYSNKITLVLFLLFFLGGRWCSKILRNIWGWYVKILTIPYRGGWVVWKRSKTPLRNIKMAPYWLSEG